MTETGRGWMGWRPPGNARYTSSQTTSQRCGQAWANRALERAPGLPRALSWAATRPVDSAPLPHALCLRRHRGTPDVSRKGPRAVRHADRRAGRGGGTKRRPRGHGLERGGAPAHHDPTRPRADVHLVLHHQSTGPPAGSEQAEDRGGHTAWGPLHWPGGLAHHGLVGRPPDGAEAPSASWEGSAGGTRGQGPCRAPSPDPLVQRHSPCRATGDAPRRQEAPGGRWSDVGDPGEASTR